jgi:FMN phosphatase YigB (HAD superfamily)
MKYLIFDFDGVLGDTNRERIDVIKEIDNVSEEEVVASSERYWMQSHHTRNADLSEEKIGEMLEWTRRFGEAMAKRNFNLFDGFISEIANIKDTKLAIVSSGSRLYIKPKLENTSLTFTHILTFEDHHSKEEKLERICRDWGITVDEAYFFTDTVADVRELENILDRNKIYGCSWGYQGKEKLSLILDSEHIFNNFSDIREVFPENQTSA